MLVSVAIPVPLHRTFTYEVADDDAERARPGMRAVVPIRNRREIGVILGPGEAPPGIRTRRVIALPDTEPVLTGPVLALCQWMAEYYVAPLGEVLRGMLPLAAEVKRHFSYRITEAGRKVLYEGAAKGSSRRSRLTAEEQNREYAVLNYLEGGAQAKMSALRSATGANKGLLEGMVRKKWLVREACRSVGLFFWKRKPTWVMRVTRLWRSSRTTTTTVPFIPLWNLQW